MSSFSGEHYKAVSTVELSEGDVRPMIAGVFSMLSVTLAVAELPLASVAVPLTSWPAPSLVMTLGEGQLTTAESPGVHVNDTVTFELFQPALFGAGEAVAATVSGVPTANPTPLLDTPPTVTTMFPVVAAAGMLADKRVLLQLT